MTIFQKGKKINYHKRQDSYLSLERQKGYCVKEGRHRGLLGCWHILCIDVGSTYTRVHFIIIYYTDIYDLCTFLYEFYISYLKHLKCI